MLWEHEPQASVSTAFFELSQTFMSVSATRYIITQVILTFWLVLAYDLLEERLFPPCFKMAENLDNILRERAKDKGQKSLAKALNRFEKQEEER